MSKSAPISLRVTSEEKNLFFKNAKALGIAPSTLLTMFIKNFNRHKKITLAIDSPVQLESFTTDSVENIMKDFEKTGKYNRQFLEDLEKGLKRSKLNASAK